ncbi:MAG: Hpt domain-containing protein [Verrucomicrobia bacterium]|nr:Hpt domain-containing protein [Verrucomicrobiota bacterium]
MDNILQLTGKIAVELVYAEPGKDVGLLPVNCLFNEIKGYCKDQDLPPSVNTTLGNIEEIINGVLDRDCLFTGDEIRDLTRLTDWLERAWLAIRDGGVLPEKPVRVVSDPAPGNPPQGKAHTRYAGDGPDSEKLQLNLEEDTEIVSEFITEAVEHLQSIELGLLMLEQQPHDKDMLALVFRDFHTLKGGSGLLNLTPITYLAHELESLLDFARSGRIVLNTPLINLIFSGVDCINRLIIEINKHLASGGESKTIDFPWLKVYFEVGTVVDNIRSRRDPECAVSSTKTDDAADNSKSETNACYATGAGAVIRRTTEYAMNTATIKIAANKLDALTELIDELVITQSLIEQDAETWAPRNGALYGKLMRVGRITQQLQRTAVSLRMVPLKNTFNRLYRLVRDMSAYQGKSVSLKLSGEETELDRTLVERIRDPLVQMVRNAIDHGIEPPEERVKNDKLETGIISISASREGDNVIIKVSDDGNGLNAEMIRTKALENGMIKPDQDITQEQLYRLIFEPGFTTACAVTNISGRGVGMDVVAQNIEEIHGKVIVDSMPGGGTTFTIILPQTPAIIHDLACSGYRGAGQSRASSASDTERRECTCN